MTNAVLALNAGSSSIKFALFEIAADNDARLVVKGLLETGGSEIGVAAKDPDGKVLWERRWEAKTPRDAVLRAVLEWVDDRLGDDLLVAAGHRIVHGGREFHGPVRLDDRTIEAIDRLTPLAPLHQPRGLELIRALRTLRPKLTQVGCFDTAFHHDLAPPVSRYAIPRHLEEAGLRKYGFHGLSYEFIASRLPELDGALPGKRAIVAHLGQGASLCAMRNGRSLDTTMGFSTLDGLVMGSRCGAIDPGVVLYLLKTVGMGPDAVERMLYHESGLLGVSGLSADMRTLSASEDPRAREAIDLFTFRVARETAALANTLGGLELVVFTGGIGEHSPAVRAAVGDRLRWLGVEIEATSNERSAPRIDGGAARVEIRIIPTNEEIVIARHTIANL
jgi:acetate kinase